MVLRLSEGVAERNNWQYFIECMREHYQDDELDVSNLVLVLNLEDSVRLMVVL